MSINGIAFQHGHQDSREESLAAMWASYNRVPYRVFDAAREVPNDYLPIGTVRWVEDVLFARAGLTKMRKVWRVTPDYYPEFLKYHLHRQVYLSDTTGLNRRFVKPSLGYKDFDAYIAPEGTTFSHAVWMSEVVEGGFDNEWRYYVTGGQVVASGWYKGRDEDAEAPKLDVAFPSDYSGAVDFGIVDGRLTLVEAQHPYSCGWYGGTSMAELDVYVKWLGNGYDYMTVGLIDGSVIVN